MISSTAQFLPTAHGKMLLWHWGVGGYLNQLKLFGLFCSSYVCLKTAVQAR